MGEPRLPVHLGGAGNRRSADHDCFPGETNGRQAARGAAHCAAMSVSWSSVGSNPLSRPPLPQDGGDGMDQDIARRAAIGPASF